MSAFQGIPPGGDPELERILLSDELELLAEHCYLLAARYEATQSELEDPALLDIARTLTAWRRERARYFTGAAAKAESREAAEVMRQKRLGRF